MDNPFEIISKRLSNLEGLTLETLQYLLSGKNKTQPKETWVNDGIRVNIIAVDDFNFGQYDICIPPMPYIPRKGECIALYNILYEEQIKLFDDNDLNYEDLLSIESVCWHCDNKGYYITLSLVQLK